MRLLKHIIFTLFLANTSISLATQTNSLNWQNLQWQVQREEQDITLSIANVKDSAYIAVKTETQIETSLTALVKLVMDADASTEWVDRCVASDIYDRISNTEYYQYFISKPPWPLKKRDFLLRVKVSQDEQLKVSISAEAANNIYPVQENIVRITQTDSLWEFVPLNHKQVRVINYAYVEPAGGVPKWLVNSSIGSTPFKTLRNMRNIIKKKRYDNNPLPFIKEKR